MARKFRDQAKPGKTAPASIKAMPEEQFPSFHQLKWSLTFLLVYFGLRLLYFAITISPYVPPDEHTHFELSRIFSKVFFLPENAPETYEYGLVTNIPWLYYWIMGKLLFLNLFGIHDLLFLRLLNIPFAFATVYFVWRTLRLLTDDRLSQILLIVAMTNTIMFSFLSAFVSYDNLTNLLAAMAVYYLLTFFKNRSSELLVVSFFCQMAGSLTKFSFLPLVLVLNILLILYEFKNIRMLPGALSGYFKAVGWRHWGLAIGFCLGLALNIQLYGGNYVHYGTLAPEMSRVLSPDKAMQNRLVAQALIFNQFKEGLVTKEEALAMTSQIGHPGDRNETIFMIENYTALKNNEFHLLSPMAYTVFWVRQMYAGTFGIFGHLQMANRGPTIWPFAALSMVTCLAFLVRWRPRDAAWLPTCMMVIVVCYSLFLLYVVNYPIYLDSGAPGSALTGRYIFPVLGPIYVLASYYLLRLFTSSHIRLGIAVTTAIIFISSDLPYFLIHVTPDWFIPLFR